MQNTKNRQYPRRPIHGWLVLDKPEGMSSAALVAQAKRALGAAKVGHAGTLDPLASGILPLAFGEATKAMPYVLRHDKTYEFRIAWGTTTTTDDREGEPVRTSPHRPSAAAISDILPRFIGAIAHVPPVYSALKVGGKRACDRARAGETMVLPSRTVVINELNCTAVHLDGADFTVHCGSGTYVRALARDIAEALGTAGHISALRRTGVSGFTAATAYAMSTFLAVPEEQRETLLLPLDAPLADIPVLALNVTEANALRHGQRWRQTDTTDSPVMRAYFEGHIIGMVRAANGWVHPIRVFNL